MNTKIRCLLLALLIASASNSYCQENVSIGHVYTDIILFRPLGLGMTMTGAALFAVVSPMLAVSDLTSAHGGAFDQAKNALVMTPFKYTFDRPLGVFKSGPDDTYLKH